MAEKKSHAPAPDAEPPRAAPKSPITVDRPDTVIPPNWGPNMLIYGDVSRMLFRMHRNVAAHMDAHKRLAERMQTVFSHEQALVLELAKLVDDSMSAAQRSSNKDKPPLAADSIERIFDHASSAMKETGRMMTEIQLESLALLQHYIEATTDGGKPAAPKPESDQGTGKKE
jgi:hypothetical protein